MAGGLLQIINFSATDLFITGNPQITFFKAIYRRYTNFAIEAIRMNFNGITDFGRDITCKLEKLGDLVHKTYLNIVLPEVNILKTNYDPNAATPYDLYGENIEFELTTFTAFMNINTAAYRAALSTYNPYRNSETVETEAQFMVNSVITTFETMDPDGTITELARSVVNNDAYFSIMNLLDIVNDLSDQNVILDKTVVHDAIVDGMDVAIEQNRIYYFKYIGILKQTADAVNKYSKFAWVRKLGHAILEKNELMIGGNKIDAQSGDWNNIWCELSNSVYQTMSYNRMIGDVSELTSYDRNKKPSYELSVPLQFWFCRHSGLSLPLVALQYHDVVFNIKLRPLNACCFIEPTSTLFGKITLQDAYLLVDYIFLDSDERKKFAQSAHEYLIEQIQLDEFLLEPIKNFEARLSLVHPCKELIWVYQMNKFVNTNYDENAENFWYAYGLDTTIEGEPVGNPIDSVKIVFNGTTRQDTLPGSYYNYVQPYEKHNRTPSDGINVYSFALRPEEHQPSGSCDLSLIDKISLYITFNDAVTVETSGGSFRVYALNYNILRIFSGVAGLAYN
jgi:hypothetical protein